MKGKPGIHISHTGPSPGVWLWTNAAEAGGRLVIRHRWQDRPREEQTEPVLYLVAALVRDVTNQKDKFLVRTRNAPRVMAWCAAWPSWQWVLLDRVFGNTVNLLRKFLQFVELNSRFPVSWQWILGPNYVSLDIDGGRCGIDPNLDSKVQ
jgi:hypothetical protein